jgi:hypothetical protein
MSRKDETTRFLGLTIGKDESPVAPELLRASDSEEWAWMIDEDPAFYLTKPGSVETTGA